MANRYYHVSEAMEIEPLTVGRIAELIGGTVEGDSSVRIESMESLGSTGAGGLTFAADNKRAELLVDSQAGAAIVGKTATVGDTSIPLIRVEDVHAAVATLLGYLSPPDDLPPVGVDQAARVSPDAQLGENVRIAPGVVIAGGTRISNGSALCGNVLIGSNVEIGKDVVLCEGVSVHRDCIIGDRVVIGPNSVIGYDGFGYYHTGEVHKKVPHIGNVVIEDDVEIGACTCIDRAKFGSTRIGAGSKIDNLVQVAHNVQMGRGCLLAGQCGIAGSVKMGDFVVLGGKAGIRDNVSIGNRVTCGGATAVLEDVPDGATLFGIPGIPAKEKFRQILLINKLPELVKRLRELEKRLDTLEFAKDH